MVTITRISRNSPDFPPTTHALTYPNGLLAVGGDLTTERLLQAYQRGIFPWYEDPQPIMWWSPDPRSILFPEEIRVSKSLRKHLRRCGWRITADRAFSRVVTACAAPRELEAGTWITGPMERAYQELHRAGYAHSVEVWDQQGQLLGGLYGVALHPVFFGESMFSRATDASKMAFVAAVQHLRRSDYSLIDCQVESEHLNSLGARNITRLDFESHLEHTDLREQAASPWTLDIEAGELL